MMKPYYQDDMVTVYHGDNRAVLANIDSDSIDSCVTDPPYELGFMGKGWDGSGIAYDTDLWSEVWRVLKPGGHLLAFGGTRTWHRLAVAIEDAGFEVRDSMAWMYGSGFPKSLDVSKAIDKKRDDREEILRVTGEIARLRDMAGLSNRDLDDAFGFAGMAGHWTSTKSQPTVPTVEQWSKLRDMLSPDEWLDAEVWRLNGRKGTLGESWNMREITGQYETPAAAQQWMSNYGQQADLTTKERRDKPATPAAEQWQGWGTALKPAFEPVVVARKPLIGTVAANVQEYGTGALNIDGCRIAGEVPSVPQPVFGVANGVTDFGSGVGRNGEMSQASGRWPANVILDESQAAELDRQSGVTSSKAGGASGSNANPMSWNEDNSERERGGHTDTGGASRFFYTAKASKRERPNVDGVAHPTVKPIKLMQYLVRLVTPPGGTILEPFAGSGTTLEAATIEGFNSIGIELTDEYLPLIVQRLNRHTNQTLL
jgi:DNA modification methylase